MSHRIIGMAALLLLALPFVASSADAQAQALKVGYTDHEVIILNMPDYQKIQQQLQQEYQGSQQELQTLYADYQEKLEKYQKQQALLSEQRRAEREQELMTLQGEIQKAAAQKDQDLAKREAELMQPLLERVQTAIDEVAKQKGLDIVMRTQVGTQPLILYVNEKTITDITPDVARKLGLDVSDTSASN